MILACIVLIESQSVTYLYDRQTNTETP